MSAKPWEQEWRKGDGKEKHSYGVFHATGYWVVLAANEEDAQFIAAAPRLYRALEALMNLKGLSGYISSTEEWTDAMAALKAARGEE